MRTIVSRLLPLAVVAALAFAHQAVAQMPGETRITCPNVDPWPCPDCCPSSGGSSDGGGGSSEASKSNAGPDLATAVGDPVDVSRGIVMRHEVDFSIPVKYGLELRLERLYSSGTFSTSNNNWEGMFGGHWYCPYEMRIVSTDGGFIFIDGRGIWHHMEYVSSGLYRARIDQGEPLEMAVTGSGSGTVYTITTSARQQYIFDWEGKVTAIEADAYTQAQERLTFEYQAVPGHAGKRRLWKVKAPAGDDRYLEFAYGEPYLPFQVGVVYLKTSTMSYPVFHCWYATYGLAYVKYGTPASDYCLYYEYGRGTVNGSGVLTMTPDWCLGRVGYFLSPGYRDLVCYYWNPGTYQAEKIYHYDFGQSKWLQSINLVYNGFYNSSVAFGDGVGNDPTTHYTLDYKRDLQDMTYSNLTSKMPKTTIFPPDGYGSGAGTPRLVGSSNIWDPSLWQWFPIWKYTYDLANSSYLDRYRLLAFTKYATNSPASAMTTSTSYNATYPARVAVVTNPEGETTSYGYYTPGTHLTFPYLWGRVWQVSSAGVTTSFSYNGSGQLSSVTTPEGTVSLVYDSRGNVSQVTHPDGNVVTRTYNDFGQIATESQTRLGTVTHRYSNDATFFNGSPVPSGEWALPPRLVELTDSLGKSTRFFYDSSSRTTQVTDPNGNSVYYDYDNRGRRTAIYNDLSEVQTFSYDLYDRMTAYTDGRGKSTWYLLDEFGRVVRETDHDGYYTEYTYTDATTGCSSCGGAGAALVSRIRKPNGRHVHFTYDLSGRRKTVDYEAGANPSNPFAPEITLGYDKASRLLSAADTRLTTSGNSYSFLYDTGSTGRLLRMTHPEGYFEEYFHAATGELQAYRDVDGNIQEYTYDSFKRLATMTDAYGGVTTWTYATAADPVSYPIGSLKRRQLPNGASDQYTFQTTSGRIQRISHRSSSNAEFDYVNLAYDDAGLIASRERQESGSPVTTFYSYDEANRLTEERNKQGSTDYSKRLYGYDAAGNRSSSTFWNSGGTNLTTTLAYGNRNQLTGTSNYLLAGGAGSGAVTYAFDAEGNMTARSLPGTGTSWIYSWNDDNRLQSVRRNIAIADEFFFIMESWITEYRYDFAGQRILKRAARDPMIIGGPQPQRTRYFFSGLTETVRKVSVGTHADTSFAFVNKEDGSATGWAQGVGTGGSVTSVYDSARRSNVARFLNGGRFDKGMNNETRRVASFWFKRGLYNPTIVFHIQTSAGDRRINLYTTSGTNGFSGLDYSVYLGTGVANGQWHRIERDLGAIVSSLTPGVTFTKTYGTWIWSSDCYLDDLRFSNSISSEHAVLAPGAIGHIVRRRTVDTTTYLATATDRFLHYDQVGSVHHESNVAGGAVQKHYQDSFGNTVAAWNTGMWGGVRAGFHHNTKEFDEDADLVYMHQRWYLPEVGVFLSKAPYPVMVEHSYSFALQNPTLYVDTNGREPVKAPDMGGGGGADASGFKSNCVPKTGSTMADGSPPPKEGSKCSGSCFDFRDANSPIGPHQPGVVNPGSGSDGSLVDYYPVIPGSGPSLPSPDANGNYSSGAHVGIMVGGCVANCHGGYVRYYDPAVRFIPHTQFPSIAVDIVIRPF